MKYIKKITVVGISILSISLFSGCTLNNLTGDSSWLPEEYMKGTEQKIQISEEKAENYEKKSDYSQDSLEVTNPPILKSISEEEFAKAFSTYIEKNPVEFGKKVDKAYQIYQDTLKKESAEKINKKAESIRDISKTDHIKGAKNPKFVLFEYSDYHCPYCKRFNPTTSEFLKNNDDVALVFRAYPAVHKETSAPLHELAECIAKYDGNDGFWKFTDIAFEQGTQLSLKNANEELKKIKISNRDKILTCSKNREFKGVIEDSEKEAQSLGIQGTPGSILKNLETGEVRVISGAYPLEALEKFKEELSK